MVAMPEKAKMIAPERALKGREQAITYEEVRGGSTGHAEAVLVVFDPARTSYREQGYPAITTEIAEAGPFYDAEDEHQQYLDKNPMGYRGLGGTGVSCPIGTGVPAQADAVVPG